MCRFLLKPVKYMALLAEMALEKRCFSNVLLPLTSGSIQVNGRHIETGKTVPDDIGAIIETPGFLPNYSGFRNLKFLATLRGRIKDAEIRKAMQQVGLDPESRKHVGKYSLGMRQRLGIAQAIMEHPKLLVLDEPMNGLDNNGVREMRELFIALKKEGTTILMATHSSDDVRELCDTVHEMDCGVISKRDDLNSFPTT